MWRLVAAISYPICSLLPAVHRSRRECARSCSMVLLVDARPQQPTISDHLHVEYAHCCEFPWCRAHLLASDQCSHIVSLALLARQLTLIDMHTILIHIYPQSHVRHAYHLSSLQNVRASSLMRSSAALQIVNAALDEDLAKSTELDRVAYVRHWPPGPLSPEPWPAVTIDATSSLDRVLTSSEVKCSNYICIVCLSSPDIDGYYARWYNSSVISVPIRDERAKHQMSPSVYCYLENQA